MYRRAVMMEQERMENEHFVLRLGNLPVVNSAWTQAMSMYQYTKEFNAITRATCNLAEGSVSTVVTTTKPYVEKYQPQIEKVNAYACDKLAVMEEQYPVITKPTNEVWKEGMERYGYVISPVTCSVNAVKNGYNGIVNKGHNTVEATKEKVESVKEYGLTKVNQTLDTPLGKFALEKVNEALTVSEEYVEKYLPPTEEEMDNNAPMEVDEVNTFTRVTSLSSKLRHRMYKRAMKDLKGVQMRSREKLDRLHFTVDLIQYAKMGVHDVRDTIEEKYEVAQKKMADYWEKINSEEGLDKDEASKTLEGKTLIVARQITRQVKNGMNKVSGYIPTRLQPAIVRERMEQALKYSEDLYQSFKQAQGFDDLPSWLLQQAKEKMAYVQETLSFLTDTFLMAPISWLAPGRSVEAEAEGRAIEMGSMQHQHGARRKEE